MLVAATTVAALLIASPSTTDADRIAANGGFLIGSAHRCEVDTDRVVRAGQLVKQLIAAASADSKEEEAATTRFAKFFLVSAFPDKTKEKAVASCKLVIGELARLEQHQMELIGSNAASDDGRPHFRLSDGE